MESQKDFRVQRDEHHEMMQKFNNLMIDNKRLVADNDHKSSQLKQVSLSGYLIFIKLDSANT